MVKALDHIKNNELIRVIYVSKISKKGKQDKLIFEHIIESAENYNQKNQITGMLCNNEKYFVQCLEGKKQAVLPLMKRIYSDKRHKNVTVISLKALDTHNFSDWRMHSLDITNTLLSTPMIQEGFPELSAFMPFRPLRWSESLVNRFVETIDSLQNSRKYYPLLDLNFNRISHHTSIQIMYGNYLFYGFLILVLIGSLILAVLI